MWIDDNQDNESGQEINDRDYVVENQKDQSLPAAFLATLWEIRRFGLTIAAVGILKTIDDDIPVILKAYTTLKSDGHVYLLIQNCDLILRFLYWISSSS
nr:hypothetical protein CFP56_70185 [Quercus suber]POF21979.1 hypothetical protein CFP56_70186 [Quercus suber]